MRKPRHSRLSAGVGVQTHCAVFHLPTVVTMSVSAPQHRIKWDGASQVPSACHIVHLQSVRDIFLLAARRLLFSSSFEQEIEKNRTFSDPILPPNPSPLFDCIISLFKEARDHFLFGGAELKEGGAQVQNLHLQMNSMCQGGGSVFQVPHRRCPIMEVPPLPLPSWAVFCPQYASETLKSILHRILAGVHTLDYHF